MSPARNPDDGSKAELDAAGAGDSQRLFVALGVDEGVRGRLSRAARQVRRHLPKARWVPEQNLHLTLVFLGDTWVSLIEGLHRELRAACVRIEPFDLRVWGLGVFPPRGSSRVLWAGLEANGDLEGLQYSVVHAAGRAVGRELRERRAFRPHVTLARCNPPWPPRAVARWRDAMGDFESEPFAVDEVLLMSSQLGGPAPQYRVVERYPLGGS